MENKTTQDKGENEEKYPYKHLYDEDFTEEEMGNMTPVSSDSWGMPIYYNDVMKEQAEYLKSKQREKQKTKEVIYKSTKPKSLKLTDIDLCMKTGFIEGKTRIGQVVIFPEGKNHIMDKAESKKIKSCELFFTNDNIEGKKHGKIVIRPSSVSYEPIKENKIESLISEYERKRSVIIVEFESKKDHILDAYDSETKKKFANNRENFLNEFPKSKKGDIKAYLELFDVGESDKNNFAIQIEKELSKNKGMSI